MSLFDPNKDGVDHINAYSQSSSWLGMKLSNFDRSPINHPIDGKFESLEGYWYFLLTGEEKFRELFGIEAKLLGKEFKNKDAVLNVSQDTKYKFYLALKEKIYSNEELKEALKRCELPIVHYYTRKDKFGQKFVVNVSKHSWIWDQVHAIRCDIQGKECNIDLFKKDDKEKEEDSQLSFF